MLTLMFVRLVLLSISAQLGLIHYSMTFQLLKGFGYWVLSAAHEIPQIIEAPRLQLKVPYLPKVIFSRYKFIISKSSLASEREHSLHS